MRRTRRWEHVRQEATRLADMGMSQTEIAERIDMHVSNVGRWIKAGKLTLKAKVVDIVPLTGRPKKTPAEWADAIRGEYDLDETDDQLVTLAESALAIHQDPGSKRTEKLNAIRTFRGLVAQLSLVARVSEQPGQQPTTVHDAPARAVNPPVRRRSKVDPRDSFMRIVK